MTLGRITRRRTAGNNLMFVKVETFEPLSNKPVSVQLQINYREMQRNGADPHKGAVKDFQKQTWRGDWIGERNRLD